MRVAGIEKSSFTDYPNHIAAIIHTQGCNLNCPYCNKKDLIPKFSPDENYTSLKDIEQFLDERKDFFDGIVLTGGEPTLQSGLTFFLKKIKSMGLKIKLNTNGTRPKMLQKLIEEGLVDYIEMNIKTFPGKYLKLTERNVVEEVLESISFIMGGNIDYNFKTIVVPKFHTEEDMKKIGKLIKGAKKFCIQNFKPNSSLMPTFEEDKFLMPKLEIFKEIVKPYVKNVEIRNG